MKKKTATKFDFEMKCNGCNGNTFHLRDTREMPQKTVLELAQLIAREGVVNLNMCGIFCAGCGKKDTVVLTFKPHGNEKAN